MAYEIYVHGLEHVESKRREDFRRVRLRKRKIKNKEAEKLNVNFSLPVAKDF